MAIVLIQTAFNSMISRRRWCQNAAGRSFPNESHTINQLGLNLVDICLDATLQILCKSLLYLEKFGKVDDSETAKIWLVKFYTFNYKVEYLAQFVTDFTNLYLKI